MNTAIELLRDYTRRAQTPAEGEQLGIVADVLSDQLRQHTDELEVQMRRLLADVAFATNS